MIRNEFCVASPYRTESVKSLDFEEVFVANQSPWWLGRDLEYLFFQHEEKSELKICQLFFYWPHFEQKLEGKYVTVKYMIGYNLDQCKLSKPKQQNR